MGITVVKPKDLGGGAPWENFPPGADNLEVRQGQLVWHTYNSSDFHTGHNASFLKQRGTIGLSFKPGAQEERQGE
jgi:hypothetical protein